jgi:hypothetical protein
MRGQLQGDTFLAALDVAICHVDCIYTLVQLSGVSRRCKAICAAHHLQDLLLPVLCQVAAQPKGPLLQQHLGSIKWICNTASAEAVQAVSEVVVQVPNVPAAAAFMLVKAGVRVSPSQVLAAALRQQPGVEVWVQAHVAVHGATAAVDSSPGQLHAAFWQRWASTTAAATATAKQPSLLQVVACFAKDPQVRFYP